MAALTNVSITPENTVFVLLCFEGPDVYSAAGGLGTRVSELSEALALQGFPTHLIFVGDPLKPGREERVNGKLVLERWCQWISKYHPGGVYQGEDGKLNDFNESVPYHVCTTIVRPAIEEDKLVVIMGEDWHTAEALCRISDLLYSLNMRHRTLLLWNINSTMSFHRINWSRLGYCTTITTVSRYMKHYMWDYGINPLVIPNGIPGRHLDPIPESASSALREIIGQKLFLFKIGRFDPDKRWLMAVEAVARLKYAGRPVTLLARGGMEPHGHEVIGRAHYLGLQVKDVRTDARPTKVQECLAALAAAGEADILNLAFFAPEEFVRVCYAAADAVLANSGHEPFGLVALEVMAAGGIAFTGATGEDYAVSFENCISLDTDDPDEIIGYLGYLQTHGSEQQKIRRQGVMTASQFTWEEVIANLIGKLQYLARRQNVMLPAASSR